MMQCFRNGNLVIRMLAGRMPALVACLFAKTLGFLAQNVRYVGFRQQKDDSGQAIDRDMHKLDPAVELLPKEPRRYSPHSSEDCQNLFCIDL